VVAGLPAGEAFVDKVSEVIARKTSADPRYGERLAEGVLAAVEALRDELLLRQAFARSSQRESGREERPAEYGELIDRIDRILAGAEELLPLLSERERLRVENQLSLWNKAKGVVRQSRQDAQTQSDTEEPM